MSAAGPSQGAAPPRGEASAARFGGQTISAAGPWVVKTEGAVPLSGAASAAAVGGES
jgi:hypothetical protein